MNRRLIRAISTVAALAALSLSVPALADGHGHGGGNGGGGGVASARGGGGYAGARGGYSMSHGAAPASGRMGGYAPARGGVSGPRAVGGYNNGGRYAGTSAGRFGGTSAGRFDGRSAARYGNAPTRVYSSPRFSSGATYRSGDRNFGARPGFNRPVHGIGYGGRPRYWAGGNFRGSYWPRSYYHSGFVRFFPVLPAFYSTYWFGGLPYYYWDDTYYTYSSVDSGYVATDPPPAADVDSSDNGSADVQSGDSSSLYIYPKNGQSEEQTATDRYECHQWAASQTGFDPTNGGNQSAGASPSDYRRAMSACLDARGYSAR